LNKIISQVSLELGGKSPCLVFESADLEQGEYQSIHLSIPFQALFVSTLACDFMLIDILVFSHLGLTGYSLAANWAALGICYNTGQDCTAGSRVYVQESIYDNSLGYSPRQLNPQSSVMVLTSKLPVDLWYGDEHDLSLKGTSLTLLD